METQAVLSAELVRFAFQSKKMKLTVVTITALFIVSVYVNLVSVPLSIYLGRPSTEEIPRPRFIIFLSSHLLLK